MRQKTLSYSPFPTDPLTSSRAESSTMRLCFRMLPRRCSHPRGASAASLLHPNIYISCFLPGCIWAAFLQEMDSLWWVLGSDVIPSGPVKQAKIAKGRRRRKKKVVALQALTWLKHLYAVGERALTLLLFWLPTLLPSVFIYLQCHGMNITQIQIRHRRSFMCASRKVLGCFLGWLSKQISVVMCVSPPHLGFPALIFPPVQWDTAHSWSQKASPKWGCLQQMGKVAGLLSSL